MDQGPVIRKLRFVVAFGLVGYVSAFFSEILDDLLGQLLVDFPMPWDGLRKTCFRIVVDIVLSSMPKEKAS